MNAVLSKLAREAWSLTGLLALSTTLTVGASWLTGDVTVIVVGVVYLVPATVAVFAFGLRPPWTWPLQWSLRRMLLVVTCFAILFATLAHQAPFRIRFALSRGALERLADRVERGEPIRLPQSNGLFAIRKIESRENGRYTCLWNRLGASGYSGFVRRKPATAPRYNRNVWWSLALDDDWEWVIED